MPTNFFWQYINLHCHENRSCVSQIFRLNANINSSWHVTKDVQITGFAKRRLASAKKWRQILRPTLVCNLGVHDVGVHSVIIRGMRISRIVTFGVNMRTLLNTTNIKIWKLYLSLRRIFCKHNDTSKWRCIWPTFISWINFCKGTVSPDMCASYALRHI